MCGMRTGRSSSKVSRLAFPFFFFYFHILPGVCGKLECEDGVVQASIQHSLCSWCHVEQLSSEPNQSSSSNNCVSIKDWIRELRQALFLQNNLAVKMRISKCTEPTRGCSYSDPDKGSTETLEGIEGLSSLTRGESTRGNGILGSDEGRAEGLERPEGVSCPKGGESTRGDDIAGFDEGSTENLERPKFFSFPISAFSRLNLNALLVCLLSFLASLYFLLHG